MPRIKANIIAAIVKIDGSTEALFFNGTNHDRSWRELFDEWFIRMDNDGHKIKIIRLWRSDQEWPFCNCSQTWASPNQMGMMFYREGRNRKLEDIKFEPYRMTPESKNTVAKFSSKI